MKYPFTHILILFNPNSTGSSKHNAQELKSELEKKLTACSIELLATQYAGHAEEIGANHAHEARTLIVSSSGDGGYNELVNGVLQAHVQKVTVSVLPSGNANDHASSVSSGSLLQSIVAGKTTMIDVLKIQGKQKGKLWQRYAHSYIGVGVTAYIGKKLTQKSLNPINEKWYTLKYLLRFGHVSLKIESWRHTQFHRYNSLVAANINRMSKVIKLDQASSVTDGQFEVYATRSRSLLHLFGALMSASVRGEQAVDRTNELRFVTKRRCQVQCDGEVFGIDGGEMTAVTVRPRALKTIL